MYRSVRVSLLLVLILVTSVTLPRSTLAVTSTNLANPASITIPGSGTQGPASLYPSTITVAGVTGTVTKVTVVLGNLSHAYPGDMDILLVGPTGHTVLLMSDAGWRNDVFNITLNFDDAATAFIPFETLVTTGTYRPTDYESMDAFPTPAPAGPYGTTLGVFNGHNPNGTWALYVVDDVSSDVGQLPAGWSLGIETSDPLPPTIEITSPADGAQYLLNHPVNVDYGCTDETGPAGVVTCAGPVPTGTALAASTVGLHTFTVTAEDVDGNSATRTHNYSVVYPFSGFLQPVDNAGSGPVPVVNTAKAGSAIPVKFRLGGNQGLAIFPGGTPVSKPMNCDGSATTDPVEQTVTAGSSSLQYDATTDTYTYVWKTEKRWAATCRVLFVTLNDGTEYPAYFRFTK